MARVIKGPGDKRVERRPADPIGGGKRRVLEKEVYKAKQQAEEIKKEADARVEQILHEGKKRANQLREEAQSEGATEAFAEAAAEALLAFRRRAERYAEASDDIRVLALEVVRKVLGTQARLSSSAIDAIVEQGMNRLRARRKLRLLLPPVRLDALERERPALVRALKREPDILLEPASDVSSGYCRVVTEVGGALCSEQAALDSLAEAIEVDEQAIAPAPRSAVNRLDDEEDESTHAFRERPAVASAASYGGVGLNVTSPGLDSIQIDSARVRPLEGIRMDTDPEATMALDVADLRADLDKHPPADDEDDDLDLFADDSLPE